MRKLFLFFYSVFSIILSGQNYIVDVNFNKGIGANNTITNMDLQSDGKIIIVGPFTSYDGVVRNGIARLNKDGSLDQSFNSEKGLNIEYGNILAIEQQQNGKILIAGTFKKFNEVDKKFIARLNSDGSLDNTFNVGGTGASDSVFSIAQQTDGKILIAGDFTNFNGISRGKVARLTVDGSLDITFDSSVGSNNFLNWVSLQPDGKALIGGYIDKYNNIPRRTVARLNMDGSLDNTFAPYGSGSNLPVSRIVSQDDGKIIVSGDFGSFNNTDTNGLARLNSDGSTDFSFKGPIGIYRAFFAHLLPEGKLLVNGNGLQLLNSDGSIDKYIGPSGKIVVQPDGSILVGSNFTSYNGVEKKYVVRLIKSELAVSDLTKENLQIYPNPVKDVLNIKSDMPITEYEIYSLDGKKLKKHNGLDNSKIDVSHLQNGNYLIKIKTKDIKQTTKFVKE